MEYPIRGTLVAAARVFLCFFGNGARVDEKCRARLRAKCRFLRSARKTQSPVTGKQNSLVHNFESFLAAFPTTKKGQPEKG